MSKLEPTVNLGYPTEPHGRVPSFSNIEEEAEFWDTHDFTDFEVEFKPSQGIVDPRLSDMLILRLEPTQWQTLLNIARERGLDPSALALTWFKERLCEETAVGQGSR